MIDIVCISAMLEGVIQALPSDLWKRTCVGREPLRCKGVVGRSVVVLIYLGAKIAYRVDGLTILIGPDIRAVPVLLLDWEGVVAVRCACILLASQQILEFHLSVRL